MPYPRTFLAMTALLAVASCGSPDESTRDAARADSGTVPDAGQDLDGGAVADAAEPDAGRDAGALPFEAIAPCDAPGDYVAGAYVSAYDSNEYDPACLRVRAGATVTIEASTDHPLAPRSGGSVASPIVRATSDATIRFDEPGFYPYLCVLHEELGMIGVVQVVP